MRRNGVLLLASVILAFAATLTLGSDTAHLGPKSAAPPPATAVTMPTHLGQFPSSFITLMSVGGVTAGCGPTLLDFQQVLPDGTVGGIYRVPVDQVLVVTDVDWQYISPSGSASAGQIETLRLFRENLLNPIFTERAFESTLTLSSAGQGGISERMTTGFVVSSKARLCPDVFPGPIGPPFGLQHLILRGYTTAPR